MANMPQIISGASIVVGLLVMIASAIFLDYLDPTGKESNEVCKIEGIFDVVKKLCDARTAGMAATSIGIIVSIVQIFYGIFAAIKLKTEVNIIWKGIHVVLAVLSIICFAVAISFQKWYKVNLKTGNWNEDVPRFFYAMTMIDAIFCIVAIVLSFTMFKK